jgi:tetratricopeptide (TPR) repeat protein
VYQSAGNYREAEKLFQRSLSIFEKVFGLEHPSVATSLNNLSALYATQGKHSEAISMQERANAIRARHNSVK